MSKGQLSELKYMVKLQEIVGPINLKLNKQTNKMELIFERSMFSICALTFGFCQFIYIWNMGLITLNWEMKVKTLMLIEYASIAVRYCSTIIGTIANRAFIIGLWNEILDLEIKYKDLNLHCRVYVKVTVILLLTPITLDFIVTSLGTALFTNMTTFFRLMQILCIFLNKSVILIINYKFFTFITMYANYFKQLNQELKNSITDASNCSLAKLKLIAMCHQCLCEHVKRISYYLSFHIILQIGDCMVLLTYHLYVVIAFFLNDQPDGNSLELNQAIFSITVSIFTILVLIIPCELCMLQANNLKKILTTAIIHEDCKELLEYLQIFSLQLLHDHLEIKANGIVDFNISTIAAIFWALTTYVVLLVQSQ